MIEVHGVDQRAEAQRLGALRHRGEKDAGRGRHAERRRVMLGQVIGVKARLLVELDQPQPLVELPAEIGPAAVHVVEDAELHPFPPFGRMLQFPHEEVSMPRLRLLLRRGTRPARAWYRTGHALGRHSRGLGLSGLRNAQVRLRDGRNSLLSGSAAGMSVRFILRAGERGYSYLPAVGLNASYVAGHPDGVITRHSSFNFHESQSGIPGLGVMKVSGDETFTPNGTGYNMHPHHNFIIMAFVASGALTHINTIGKIDELLANDYYVFSAGSGRKHSALNIGEADLQVIYVWVLPGQLLAPPSYRHGHFDRAAGANRITCLVGDEPGALPIGQTFRVSRLLSDGGKSHTYRPSKANRFYAFALEGEADIAGAPLALRGTIALHTAARARS